MAEKKKVRFVNSFKREEGESMEDFSARLEKGGGGRFATGRGSTRGKTIRLAGSEDFVPLESVTMEQRERAAKDFQIQQAAQEEQLKPLIASGLSYEEAQAKIAEQEAAQQAAQEVVSKIPTTPPKPTELDLGIETQYGETPVLGSIAEAGAGVAIAGRFQDQTYREFLAKQGYSEEDINNFNGQMLDELALTEVQKETFKQGITKSEEFGAFVESVPLLGTAIGKYVGGLVNAPYSNVKDISDEITELGSQTTELAEKAQSGYISPADAIEVMEANRIEIEKLEARLKLLASTSAILQTNSDELNKIEEKIDGAKLKIYRAEQQAALGVVKPAGEASLYLEVKKLQEGQ